MGRPVVTIDFDDVLFPFVSIVTAHMNAKFGTDYVYDRLPTMLFHKIWPLTRREVTSEIADALSTPAAHYLQAQPLPGSVEVLTWLVQYAEVDILTARDRDDYSAVVFEFASHHYPKVFRHLHLVGSSLSPDRPWRPKHEVCLELGSVFHVDDGVHNLKQIHAVGIDCVRFGKYGWNRFKDADGREIPPPPGIHSADTWVELKPIMANCLSVPLS